MAEATPSQIEPIPGEPGVYFNHATGRKFRLVEFRDTSKYDTIELESGTTDTANGQEQEFFQTVANKNLNDLNLKTARRISKGEDMLVRWLGVQIPLAVGNTLVAPVDVKKVADTAYLKFSINEFLIDEGPLSKFPSGYGIAGQTTENATGIATIGVPSTAARQNLAKWHYITSDHDLEATIKFQARAWMTTAYSAPSLATVVLVRFHVGGLVGKAATK